jgi:hypothetical protein
MKRIEFYPNETAKIHQRKFDPQESWIDHVLVQDIVYSVSFVFKTLLAGLSSQDI